MYKEKYYGRMKKIVMVILLMVILTILPTKVEAENNLSSADLLNLLHLVEGDGSGYDDDKQLTRAEAVTLILRLTKDVESNLNSKFSDLKKTDWYFDSVIKAYHLGMISGYSDGTFKANNYVTRQEFLKMILEVLGYKYDTDFTWDEVANFSETLELVTDANDSSTFLRGHAFNILIEALKTDSNKTSVTYLEKLLTLNKISEADYEAFNKATKVEFFIEDIEVTATKMIELSFSNAVDSSMILPSYFKVSVNGKNIFFQVKSIIEDEVILILNSGIKENDIIDITIFGSLKDCYGFKYNNGSTTTKTIPVFASLKDDIKVQTIVPVTTSVARVVFDQAMDLDTAMNRLNYQIKDLSEGLPYMAVSKVIATGSGELTNRQFDLVYKRFIDDYIYYLKVQNMEGLGGAYSIDSQQTKFTFMDNESSFNVLRTEAKDLNHIVLTFNQPMDEDQLKKAKISIDGITVSAKQVDLNNSYQVHVYVSYKLDVNTSYTIKMDNISSAYDIENVNLSKTFRTNDIERNAIEVEARQLAEGKLLFTFNRNIYIYKGNDPLCIYTYSYDNKYLEIDTDNYHIINANEIVLDYDYSDKDLQYFIIKNMNLSGDKFNVGDVKVMIDKIIGL